MDPRHAQAYPTKGVGAALGILSGLVALTVAQPVAGVIGGDSAPIVAVGGGVIDATPEWLKSFAIRTFGSRDKTVLLAGMVAVLVAVAVLLGIASVRRPWVGVLGLLGLGALGAAAAVARPATGVGAALPSIVGAAAGVATFLVLRRAAGPVPAGADLGVAGLDPFLTPNDRFYRVDTALFVPSVAAEGWMLRVHGSVDRPLMLTYDELSSRELIERDITLTCVSNEVGGRYVGNARWVGAPLKDILDEAGVRAGATQLVSRSADGFTAGAPTAVAMDGRDAMLAISMNGEPLPLEHGFPVRMIVPGLYGYVSATKWLVELELTTFDAFDPYWVQRGWAEEAPIKTAARIDTPRASARLAAGEIAVAGVAWAQHRGIRAVEVRVDDGPWLPAELGTEDTVDTWRQWVLRWPATPGAHELTVRATDGDGVTQTDEVVPPFPDGATGNHAITVDVA